MALTLVAGPAHAGKVSLLLERYLARLQEEPFLIVPNRSDVDAVERDLLRRTGALLGGSIGTFDDLFGRLVRGNGAARPTVTPAQRSLLLRRVVEHAHVEGTAPPSCFAGFAEALGAAVAELEAALLEPHEVDGDLAPLYAAYRQELDRLGLWDRDLERSYAAGRVAADLAAWRGEPVFAYGFEDLTGAQWALLEALAGRADVTVSLPYEPARAAFASLARTAEDLAGLAQGQIEELRPRVADYAHPAIAHLERALFGAEPADRPPLDGAVRFLEGAGARGTLELVAGELLALLRAGTPAEAVGIVCPNLERWRAPIETVFGALGIPVAFEGPVRVGQMPYGRALVSILRYAWLGGGRRDLYAFLRSPYSGLARSHVDYLEGRLRGRGIERPEQVEAETLRLRGAPIPFLERLRDPLVEGPVGGECLEAVAELAAAMLRTAHGLEAPPTTEDARLDLRAYERTRRLVEEIEAWLDRGGSVSREELAALLERAEVWRDAAGEPGRVAVLDLLRTRTRRFDVVVVLGLEEGSLPRREAASPFLPEDERRRLDGRRARIARPDPVARDRYLFYTACTRAVRCLYLAREAASDEGAPREPSAFWEEARAVFEAGEVARWTRRRPLSALTWPVEAAPTERERLRALAALTPTDAAAAHALALANGWQRRFERAKSAFDRPTRLRNSGVLGDLGARDTFSVTELEAFADCSSIWFVERVLSPKTIDAKADAKLRGSIAHTTLHRFFSRLPKRLGVERVEPDRLDDALAFLGECLTEALEGIRLELPEIDRLELEQRLRRDLEQFIRDEAALESALVPRRFEVSFGSDRSAPELQRGLDLGGFYLSGKIDRIDVDPFSARGIVQDYKSGSTAHSAAQIESELRLQIPLYMLVLRDLVGIEPLGGLYRALAGARHARGLLRAEARADGVSGFAKLDYLEEDAFWGAIERARQHAGAFVQRIRSGDVRHDPKGGFPCPTWCELGPLCRVGRA
jgi:ATP-dependent helicase/DNAse subunit B